MRCQRHLLCLLVKLWLKLCCGLEAGCFLAWKCCTKYWGCDRVRMRLRTIRERTRTMAVSHNHGHNHNHYRLRSRPDHGMAMGTLPACPASLGGPIDGLCLDRTRFGWAEGRASYCAGLCCMCTHDRNLPARLVCWRSGFAHASGVGWGAGGRG